jgi:hypothetical protein
MTSAHFLYIPAVVIVGIIIGFLLGGRAAQDRINLERRRNEERESARAARAARKSAKDAQAAESKE